MFIPISGDPCHLDQHFIRRSGVCLNVAGRDSRVEVAGADAGKGRGCELGSRVNINHQI